TKGPTGPYLSLCARAYHARQCSFRGRKIMLPGDPQALYLRGYLGQLWREPARAAFAMCPVSP
ncbi:MAG: hypothetical protein JWR88_2571, partial [Pseudonocardia sp.]|nr:hypothetical protein [Pseudonocardia sp.]